ncbi:YkgJ family cysteine cluster protein [Halobellus rufus]|uniref:YkgJ family cysteine cluster protein n=1 Tax=Halobellus rufus TaxID=1448860 RepID=UPI0006799D34|nr:YkgJ family cysteine cluster protein [Halobellus rufus]
MNVNCEGCAGCCIDWRPLADSPSDHERRGPGKPLDGAYNFVPLTRDEVARFVERGLGDVLTPRVWRVEEDAPGVVVDGVRLAALDGRPAFFVGLRKPPKPVAPFETETRWLRTCAFLDPETLQCRIHGSKRYPTECATYPSHHLDLGVETECERVEAEHGGERLLEDTPEGDSDGLLLGPQAVGAKLFGYPDPDDLAGVVDRMRRGTLTDTDRAAFVGVAAGSHPGSLAVNDERAATATAAVLDADSWAGQAIDTWTEAAGDDGELAADPPLAATVEVARGAPETPGWDAVGDGPAAGSDPENR